jgi:hypothetical protein
MNIIFQIDGGIGKSIMATAVCEAIKKQYPKDNLIVITAYPEVFLCNKFVDRCFNFNQVSYFYSTYIEGQDCKFMLHNPYLDSSFLNMEEHLIENWCGMFGIEYNGESPSLFLTEREEIFYSNQLKFEKPLMVIQTNGGAENQANKYSWARDIPQQTAQEVVDYFAKDFSIVHIRREDQLALNNTIPMQADFRNLCVLIKNSQKRLFMDSFAQHVAKALDLNSVVCWIANDPNQFGYQNNINIVANQETLKPELKQSFYSKYNIAGDLLQFPYESQNQIFNSEEIIEALKFVK